MKIVIALLMAVLASVSGFAQEERPANPVRILTAGQHITPYKIEVTFGKTVHILFPTEVRYVDLGSNNIIAGKADGVENVVRVKAAVKEFPGETNFSVITGDGSFFSYNVVYKEEPSAEYQYGPVDEPGRGRKEGRQFHPCHGTGRGRSDGHCQRDVHHPPAGPQGREAYRVQAVRDAGSFEGHLCA